MLQFDIKPFAIERTATKLTVNIISSDAESVTIYFELLTEAGLVADSGNKTIPLAALNIIAAQPMDRPGMNYLLSQWQIELADAVIP